MSSLTHPPTVLHRDVQNAKTNEDLLRALERYYKSATANADGYIDLTKPKIDCRAGCSFCCYLRVNVRAHEAFFLAEYVRKNFGANDLVDLIARLTKHVEATGSLSEQEHIKINFKCPMLVDSKCSVYAARPFACRSYHSLDVRSCKSSFHNPQDLMETRPQDETLESTWLTMSGQCHGVFEVEGYDSEVYELGYALLQALTNPASKAVAKS